MKANPNRFWFIILLLGWVFDFLFWKKAPGMNFAIFVALCLGLGLWLLWQGGARPAWKRLLLLAPIGFLAVMSFIRLEPMTTLLNYALTLAFLALRRLTGAPWRSAVAAAIFAVHPLHVESVAWISERKDVLSALFMLLSAIFYVKRASSGRIGPRGRHYFASLLLFVLIFMPTPLREY